MKTERLSIRVDEDLKKEIILNAEKNKMSTSEFISSAIKEKMDDNKLTDSQLQFMKLFDTAYKKSNDPTFKQLMVVLNRIEFNTRWSIKQQDIFMNNLKIPQTKEDVSVSVIDHPITEIAHDKVLKDIRNMTARKNRLEDE